MRIFDSLADLVQYITSEEVIHDHDWSYPEDYIFFTREEIEEARDKGLIP